MTTHRNESSFCGFVSLMAAVLATLSIALATFGQNTYSVIDLGTLPGGTSSTAAAINNNGQVVGTADNSNALNHAFLYSNGKITDLGTLGTGDWSEANAINDSGQIAGSSLTYFSYPYPHAFLYSGGMKDLGSLPGGDGSSYAYGINGGGQVVGESSWPYGDVAFWWTGSTMSNFWPNTYGSYANGINNSGQILLTVTAPFFDACYLWSGGGPIAVGQPGGAYTSTYGEAINNSGQIVGSFETNNTEHAFLYSGGQPTDLGTFGGSSSVAKAINNNGQIVGSFVTNGSEHAFLYTNGTAVDLNSLVTNSGWTLTEAVGINDYGQIVGNGTTPTGDSHAFILTLCGLNIAQTFKQGDTTSGAVPLYFGYPSSQTTCIQTKPCCNNTLTGQAKTSCFGCALCSLATMLTSLKGLESINPVVLDAVLRSHAGYSPRANVDWCQIGPTVASMGKGPIGLVDSGRVADINAYLDDHLCKHGDRVILQLTESIFPINKSSTHFVLVTGRADNNDWTVFDPGWQSVIPQENLSTLSGHVTGFFDANNNFRSFTVAGVRTYREGQNAAKLCVQGHSPIELLVTDPSGKRVGWDGANDIMEIQGSSYFRDYPVASADDPTVPDEGDPSGIKTVIIPNPIGGNYTIIATGTDTGAYTLDINTDWPGSGGQSITYSGTATNGMILTNTFFVITPPFLTATPNRFNGLTLSFPTQTNVTYAIESNNNLIGAAWAPVQTLIGTGASISINYSNSVGPVFYRVRAQSAL